MDISVLVLTTGGIAIVFWFLLIMSIETRGSLLMSLRMELEIGNVKVKVSGLLFLLSILAFAAVGVLFLKVANGEIIKVSSETRYIGTIKATDIRSEDGLTIVSMGDKELGIYPDLIAQVPTDLQKETVGTIDVSLREATITRGVQIFGILVFVQDQPMVTAVIFD